MAKAGKTGKATYQVMVATHTLTVQLVFLTVEKKAGLFVVVDIVCLQTEWQRGEKKNGWCWLSVDIVDNK